MLHSLEEYFKNLSFYEMRCFLLILVSIHLFGTIQLQQETNSPEEKQPDYFYDQALSDEEIEKAKIEKKEKSPVKQVETSTKTDPDWFKESNKPVNDPFANFLDFFSSKENKTDKQEIPPMMKEIMQKYQAEQMEKFRQSRKSTSNLNHKLLSVITLAGFFGSGIIISLAIAFTRGIKFRKLKQSFRETYGGKKKKSIYNSVEQIDNQINA